MDETTYIYGLREPGSEEIRYVGASVDPVKRARAHVLNEATAVREWVKSLQESNREPELIILEEVAARSLRVGTRHPNVAEAEDRWIVRLLDEGHPLANTRVPGRASERERRLFEEAIERGRQMFGNE